MLQADDILRGSQLAGSRLIRMLEDNDPDAFLLLQDLYPCSGNAFIIGITGAPGAGKSTLIDGLVNYFRELDKKVGILAVDPTSPFSGGAILGDRVRMQRHATDENVFIRSMASRGALGGLSRAVKDATVILDAMGFDISSSKPWAQDSLISTSVNLPTLSEWSCPREPATASRPSRREYLKPATSLS